MKYREGTTEYFKRFKELDGKLVKAKKYGT